jgi:thymidylate synthase
MRQYLDLIGRIITEGEDVQSGAVIKSQDRKAVCRTLIGQQLRFDLREGFPIVTTKPVPFDVVVDEIFWFLRGETNINTLGRSTREFLEPIEGEGPQGGYSDTFVRRKIWDQWADARGDVKRVYGEQWRRWEFPGPIRESRAIADTDLTVDLAPVLRWDQVAHLVEDLRAVVADPSNRARRRIILTAWNPPVVPEMGLPPCHTLSQWLPINGYLDVICHWRSIDMFLGCPFNMVQYALLAHIFGDLVGLTPRNLILNIADCHLYDNQFDQVREQISRAPRLLPELVIDPEFWRVCDDLSVEGMTMADPNMFSLSGYHPDQRRLKAEVAV